LRKRIRKAVAKAAEEEATKKTQASFDKYLNIFNNKRVIPFLMTRVSPLEERVIQGLETLVQIMNTKNKSDPIIYSQEREDGVTQHYLTVPEDYPLHSAQEINSTFLLQALVCIRGVKFKRKNNESQDVHGKEHEVSRQTDRETNG
jgi:hypothetical protein